MQRQDRQTRNGAASASALQFQHLASTTFSADWVEREHLPESLELPKKSKPRLGKRPQFSELEGEKEARIGCVLAAELIGTRCVKRRARRTMEDKGIHSFCFDIAPETHLRDWFDCFLASLASWYKNGIPTRPDPVTVHGCWPGRFRALPRQRSGPIPYLHKLS